MARRKSKGSSPPRSTGSSPTSARATTNGVIGFSRSRIAPGTPFGASIRSLLLYLRHSHHVGFERLSRMMAELFGLAISEGAIANAFRRAKDAMTAACLLPSAGHSPRTRRTARRPCTAWSAPASAPAASSWQP